MATTDADREGLAPKAHLMPTFANFACPLMIWHFRSKTKYNRRTRITDPTGKAWTIYSRAWNRREQIWEYALI